VTRRRDLEHHRDSLADIGEILSSMKTLAFMETRKLARFLEAQQQVVQSIAEVAADFLGFFPGLPSALQEATPVYLVVGSERGFCGDFNRAVAKKLAAVVGDSAHTGARVIAVGQKLRSVLADDESVVAFIDGASVVEEVAAVLEQLTDQLSSLNATATGVVVYGIHHDEDDVVVTSLLPPFAQDAGARPKYTLPPLLNVPPADFLGDLVDHYLLAALNGMLYASLMAENQRRVSHLDGAVRHLEDESAELTRKCKALRQEEIIEEIEVILLSAAGGENFAG